MEYIYFEMLMREMVLQSSNSAKTYLPAEGVLLVPQKPPALAPLSSFGSAECHTGYQFYL